MILVACYVIGFLLSYSMLKVEHESEKKTYTKFDRILCITFSFLSLLMVVVLLVASWFKKIAITGYWNEPVEKRSE